MMFLLRISIFSGNTPYFCWKKYSFEVKKGLWWIFRTPYFFWALRDSKYRFWISWCIKSLWTSLNGSNVESSPLSFRSTLDCLAHWWPWGGFGAKYNHEFYFRYKFFALERNDCYIYAPPPQDVKWIATCILYMSVCSKKKATLINYNATHTACLLFERIASMHCTTTQGLYSYTLLSIK